MIVSILFGVLSNKIYKLFLSYFYRIFIVFKQNFRIILDKIIVLTYL
jgi:hypothetical protein